MAFPISIISSVCGVVIRNTFSVNVEMSHTLHIRSGIHCICPVYLLCKPLVILYYFHRTVNISIFVTGIHHMKCIAWCIRTFNSICIFFNMYLETTPSFFLITKWRDREIYTNNVRVCMYVCMYVYVYVYIYSTVHEIYLVSAFYVLCVFGKHYWFWTLFL
jgi:hypothetical protein